VITYRDLSREATELERSQAWVEDELARAGFSRIEASADRGFVTIVATK